MIAVLLSVAIAFLFCVTDVLQAAEFFLNFGGLNDLTLRPLGHT